MTQSQKQVQNLELFKCESQMFKIMI